MGLRGFNKKAPALRRRREEEAGAKMRKLYNFSRVVGGVKKKIA